MYHNVRHNAIGQCERYVSATFISFEAILKIWIGEFAQPTYMRDIGKSLHYLRLFNANNTKQ